MSNPAQQTTDDLLRSADSIKWIYVTDKATGKKMALERKEDFSAKVHEMIREEAINPSESPISTTAPAGMDDLSKKALRFAQLAAIGFANLKGQDREDFKELKELFKTE